MYGITRVFALILCAAVAAGCGQTSEAEAPAVGPTGMEIEPLTIVTDTGRHDFLVEVADTEEERAQGLMFRPPLEDNQGMLFELEEVAEQSFWMRNTPSSLDIIYIGPDGRIISIARHTTPNSDTRLYSNGSAMGVVELRAGRAGEIGAEPGDQVEHPFFQ